MVVCDELSVGDGGEDGLCLLFVFLSVDYCCCG